MVFRWRRPLLLTYYDNYRYGTSLYSSTAEEVEKKYRDSLSRTYLRSDRRDLGLSTFTGSQLHGGLPAATDDSGVGTATTESSKKSYVDLYAPMSFGYGRAYYNNLRASSEPRTTTKKSSSKKSSSYYASEETSKDIKSSSTTTLNKMTKSSSDYDSLNKTVTTTTTSERWVPLSHYLYPSTTSYYYYTEPEGQTTSDMFLSDDVKVKRSTSSKIKRELDALDLSTSTSAYTSENLGTTKFDYGFWTEKCREIQSHLDHVNRWVGDAETKIKTDLVGARNKMFTELAEVNTLVEDTTKYNEELQRIIKRQAKQISELHSQHNEINQHLSEVNANLEKSRARCQGLQGELANVQAGLEMASRRKA